MGWCSGDLCSQSLELLPQMISYCHDHLDRGCIPKSLALHAMHALFQSLHSLGISLRLPASEGAQHNAEKATAMLVHTLTNFRQEVRSAALEALRQASKQVREISLMSDAAAFYRPNIFHSFGISLTMNCNIRIHSRGVWSLALDVPLLFPFPTCGKNIVIV